MMTAAFLQKYGDKHKAAYFRRTTEGDGGSLLCPGGFPRGGDQKTKWLHTLVFHNTERRFPAPLSEVSPAVNAGQHQREAAEWCFLEFIPTILQGQRPHSTSKCRTTDCGEPEHRRAHSCAPDSYRIPVDGRVFCSTTRRETREMLVHSQNWRLRLMTASVTPPTTSRMRKRFRPSIFPREGTLCFSISRPDRYPSSQPGNKTETMQTLHGNPRVLCGTCLISLSVTRLHTY